MGVDFLVILPSLSGCGDLSRFFSCRVPAPPGAACEEVGVSGRVAPTVFPPASLGVPTPCVPLLLFPGHGRFAGESGPGQGPGLPDRVFSGLTAPAPGLRKNPGVHPTASRGIGVPQGIDFHKEIVSRYGKPETESKENVLSLFLDMGVTGVLGKKSREWRAGCATSIPGRMWEKSRTIPSGTVLGQGPFLRLTVMVAPLSGSSACTE